MGDAFALVPDYEFPRVPFEDHFTIIYVGDGGRELGIKGSVVVHLPSSSTEPIRAKRRIPLPPAQAPMRSAPLFPPEVLRTVLGATGGNVTRAAKMLGTQRTSLSWHLRKAGIDANEFRKSPEISNASADTSRAGVMDSE
jgi:hypothetical protein